MKKIVFLIFIINNLNAQDYKIIYNFKWKSEEKDTIYNSEFTILTTDLQQSQFEALNRFKYDSLKTELKNKGIRSIPSPRNEWKFQQLVAKDIKNQITAVEQDIFDKTYIAKYSCKPAWQILKDKSKVFGYNAQRAEAYYGGRKWIAWFTTEVPINDGPYKFYGLPGLILKVYDEENNFIFDIKAISKEKTDISKRNRSSSTILLTPKQWTIFWEKYKKQPSNIFANLNETGATYSYVYNGKDVNTKEAQESYNKAETAKLNVFKNPIELHNCQ